MVSSNMLTTSCTTFVSQESSWTSLNINESKNTSSWMEPGNCFDVPIWVMTMMITMSRTKVPTSIMTKC